MRSLTVKLTLAFLLIGLIGAILVAVLVGMRTRLEFARYRFQHDQTPLAAALTEHYATHGSWEGVDDVVGRNPGLRFSSRGVTLADERGVVVYGSGRYRVGRPVSAEALIDSVPIEVNGKQVGFALFPWTDNQRGPPADREPPETDFLVRVTWAAAVSAAIAALTALFVGIMLARTLTRPIRELTAATQVMARGELGHHVAVRSRDEIGELATSFNQMSSDLERASQLRKQMTADLAHDLRTPLSILRGYTEGLQDGRLQGSSALYTIMHGEVEHLQRLVEDLRILSLADAGELPLHPRAVDPAALLERTGLAYIVQAEQQGITLRIEAPEELPSIQVDTDRLTQVLNNLVSNALRHTSNGEIVLSASTDSQHVRLKVRDTGQGIEPDDLPFIFDRFYRADKSRQRADSAASGLGLAIAKAIVEAHHGSISVESAPEQGTTFTIILPVSERHSLDNNLGAYLPTTSKEPISLLKRK